MSIAEKLRTAKALIEDPARWCQGTAAKSATGFLVDWDSPDALQWCAYGAFRRAGADTAKEWGFMWAAASALMDRYVGPSRLNDSTDHPTVMKMFDRAIELATKEDRDE